MEQVAHHHVRLHDGALCGHQRLLLADARCAPPGRPAFWLRLIPVALVAGGALSYIKGYTLTPGTLVVHRLLWRTRIPLDGLRSAGFEPQAMRRSLRICGNGGFFSFTGYYWSRSLGWHRALVTDLARTTVLRFATRTIVLSPDSPEDFVRELSLNAVWQPPPVEGRT